MFKKLFVLAMAMCMIFSMSAVAFATEGTIESPHIYKYRGAAVEITVPAQSRVYYEISGTLTDYISSGVIMSVTGDNNVVVYYGVRGQGFMPGQTSIDIPLDPGLMKFSLENASEEDITVYVDLVQNQSSGTMDNPYVLEEPGFVSAEVSANNDGYWISYVAPADGVFTFEMYGASDSDDNELGWTYFINNISTTVYGDKHSSDDENPVFIEEVEVSEGDELIIMMNTYEAPADQYSFPGAPAGTVNAYITFTAPEGSVDNPIWFDELLSEIEVSAGTEVYYQGRFGGSTFVLKGENVYVVYNGDTYELVNGAISIELPVGGVTSPANVFKIVNNGEEDATYTVEFQYPEGTYENPKDLEIGKTDIELEEGNDSYYLEFVAPSVGKFTINISGTNGWHYVVNNDTAWIYGDTHYSTDEVVVSKETIVVNKGDVIQVVIGTYEAPEEEYGEPGAPSGTVSLDVSFEDYAVKDDAAVSEDEFEDMEVTLKDNEDEPVLEEGVQLVVGSTLKPQFDAVKNLITSLISDKTYQVIDLSLVDDWGMKVQLEEGKTVDITLKVPTALADAKVIELFRLDEETNKLVSVDKADVVNGAITVTVNHFSTFVFADATPAQEVNPPVDNPPVVNPDKTGDMAPVAMLLVVAVAASVVVLKKRETAEN